MIAVFSAVWLILSSGLREVGTEKRTAFTSCRCWKSGKPLLNCFIRHGLLPFEGFNGYDKKVEFCENCDNI